jgi:hypothetical protein
MKEMRIVLKILFLEIVKRMLFGRARHRREDNNKMNHNKGEFEIY